MSELITYLIAGIAIGCSYALVGSGIVVVHRITRVANFAQGTFAVLGGLLAGTFLTSGIPHGVGESLAVVLSGLAGLIVAVLAIGKPGTSPTVSLVITLGISILAYAVFILFWGDGSKSSPGLSGSVEILGASVQMHYFIVIGVTLVTFLCLGFFFAKTDLGKAMTACASNPYAAKLVGINVRRMGFSAFFIAGLLGGLAGVVLTPLREISYSSDISFALYGFAAAVFGGLNSPGKTILGGLILGIVSLLVAGYLNPAYQMVAALVIMLGVMIIRSSSMVQEEAK